MTTARKNDVPKGAPAGLVEEAVSRTADLLGGTQVFEGLPSDRFTVHDMLLGGLPAASVEHLTGLLRTANRGRLRDILGVSPRTMQRLGRSEPKRLTREQSARLWKFAEIFEKAIEVFGSIEEAEAFLERPAVGLNQRSPIDLLTTPAGIDLVESFLDRIRYGVYA